MSFDTAACVRRAQAGDAGAFAELYSLVYKDLYRISLLNLNNNEQDASDVVSDTVLEAYRNIPKLRDPSSFRSWITAILTAQINKKLKEYHKERNLREDIDDLEETQPDKAQTETDFDSVALRQAMQSLSEDESLSSQDAGSFRSSRPCAGPASFIMKGVVKVVITETAMMTG